MALISAKTILTSLSLFHITLGFFFLTNPLTIADQALVYIVGEAMGLPHARDFETHSPALAFLGVVLAILGLCDLVTLSLPEEMSLVHHWGLQGTLTLGWLRDHLPLLSPDRPLTFQSEMSTDIANPQPLSASSSPSSSSSTPTPSAPPHPSITSRPGPPRPPRDPPLPPPARRRPRARTTSPRPGAATRSRTASSSPSCSSRWSRGSGSG
jgi:hypothetical protein